jgi:asparagine synthase (glutamine-hydrolysing)
MLMLRVTDLREVFDLTDPARNAILNMTLDEARARVASGDVEAVRGIEGHFALVARVRETVRLARSLSLPLRYFVVKQVDGPALVVADRIDAIREWLMARGLGEQFHPSYTRMVPAHYVTEIALIGCPDPNPTYRRFFTPAPDRWPADVNAIGRRYIEALRSAIVAWLQRLPADEPVGVCFSGGADSGAVLLVTYHAMLEMGLNPGRLKAFTLSIDGRGADTSQAREFLLATGLSLFHEVIEVDSASLNYDEVVALLEDYKPLDVQAGAMTLALCRGIRRCYPTWRYLLDGDGGDENLKDYPIEENPELTIRSVLNNRLLYHEGWGVGSIKHSLTYTGGLSRGCTRTYAPTRAEGFVSFSPFSVPAVVEVAEGIPFVSLTAWRHDRLYALKGEVLSRGVEAVTGMRMPVFEKRRFQHGAMERGRLEEWFPSDEKAYRRAFGAVHGV